MNHVSYSNGYSGADKSGIILPPYLAHGAAAPQPEVNYVAAVYCRLSREDKRQHLESVSIENQRLLLLSYCEQNEFAVYDTYIDDGYSGTSFDRPGWLDLKSDIDSGVVNTVIVKDLSRFARNSTAADSFLEEYCVERGLRFIAVSDNVDCKDGEIDDRVQMQNMMNDFYAKKTSAAVRAMKKSYAKIGRFYGSYPPFGYIKMPDNKHVLMPSVDAPIIKEIFQRFVDGETLRQICDDFNSRGVITPSMRIIGDDPEHPNRVNMSRTWNTTSMNSIISNMVYIGHLVQGKRKNVSYKSNKRKVVPPGEHIVVWNTHEAIIPLELWNAVQEGRKGRTGPKKTKQSPAISLFAGFVKCADCGGNLAAQNGKGILRCAKYNNGGSHACSSHTIRQDALYEIVLTDIRRYAELAVEDESALINRLYELLVQGEQTTIRSRQGRISALRQRIEVINMKVEKLYDEKFEKDMDEGIFKSMLSRYESDKSAIVSELNTLEAESARTRDAEDNIAAWMNVIRKAITIDELDRGILSALIDRIVVYEREKLDGQTHQRVEIFYRFVGNISLI